MVEFTLELDKKHILKFYAKEISQTKLREIWEKVQDSWKVAYGEKPFPKVRAYNVTFRVLTEIMAAYREDLEREKHYKAGERIEYGEVIPVQTCCAFTIDKRNGEYLTFRRTTSTFSVADDVEHELEHIYRNDFEEINRQLESDKK